MLLARALAASPADLSAAVDANAGLLAAMGGPPAVLVHGSPLAAFVPDLTYGEEDAAAQAVADRIMHGTALRALPDARAGAAADDPGHGDHAPL